MIEFGDKVVSFQDWQILRGLFIYTIGGNPNAISILPTDEDFKPIGSPITECADDWRMYDSFDVDNSSYGIKGLLNDALKKWNKLEPITLKDEAEEATI